MKILYFSQYYLNKGGGEKNILQLIEAFHNSDDLFLVGPLSESFKKEIQKFKIKIYEIPLYSKFNLFVYKKIKRILKDNKIDILHTMDPRARFFGVKAVKGTNIKLVHTVHSSPLFYTNNIFKKFIYKYQEKNLNKTTDKIIFVSNNTKNLYQKEKILPNNNWIVIYNGLDLRYTEKFLENKEKIKKEIFEKYNLRNNKIVTFVGRFTYQKGLPYLVSAASKIVKYFPLIKFFLVGEGKEKKEIIKKINENKLEKYFILIGFQKQEDVYKILISSDIFILPSRYELFPYSLLEAMSLGLPIVVTNVGGNNEIINDGVNGFLVQPEDENSLVEAMLKVLKNKNLAKKFSQNNLKDIEKFSLENMIRQTKGVYEEAIQ